MRKTLSLLVLLTAFSLPTLGGDIPNTVIAPPPPPPLAVSSPNDADQNEASEVTADTLTTTVIEELANLLATLPLGL